MPPLVSLLHDDEDRTRANAAGALGNLVRNSSMLCRDIMQAGALEVRARRLAMLLVCYRWHHTLRQWQMPQEDALYAPHLRVSWSGPTPCTG